MKRCLISLCLLFGCAPKQNAEVPTALAPLVIDSEYAFENMSNTPGVTGFHARFSSRQNIALWAELRDTGTNSDIDIVFKASGEGGFTKVTDVVDVQNTFPSLAESDDELVVVFNGRENSDDENDIWFARFENNTFTTPLRLYDEPSGENDRVDSRPSALITNEGVMAFYQSIERVGNTTLNADIRMVLEGQEALTLVEGDELECTEVQAAADNEGVVHFVANCGEGGREVVYGNNASGTFESSVLSEREGRVIQPKIAAGESVHLVFIENILCGNDDARCGEVMYLEIANGEVLTEISVSKSAAEKEVSPLVAEHPSGAVVIAYARLNPDNHKDILVTKKDEGDFVTASLLTATAELSETPTHLTFDATTGLPIVTFEALNALLSPIDVEIMVARALP